MDNISDILQKAKDDNKIMNVEVLYKHKDKPFYIVSILGVNAFLYENKVANNKSLITGETIPVLIEKVKIENAENPYVLVSNTEAIKQEEYNNLNVGDIISVEIIKIESNSYILVKFGSLIGLIHQSKLFWNKIRNINTYFSVGQRIDAKILIKEKTGFNYKITLSHNDCIQNPWESIDFKRFFDGYIIEVTDKEIFLGIQNGIEGTLPFSEISRKEYRKIQREAPDYKPIKIHVKEIDKEKKKLTFTRKKYYNEIENVYQTNKVYQGIIIDIEKQCIWIQLQENIEVKIPRNELHWDKVKCDTSQFTLGEIQNFLLTEIDFKNKNLFGSIKELIPNPWIDSFKVGEIIKVKIISDNKEAILIETLNPKFEGQIKLSEVSWMYDSDNLPEKYKPRKDSEIEAKIIEWEPRTHKLELSIRQLKKCPWNLCVGSVIKGQVGKSTEECVEVILENELIAMSFDNDLNHKSGEVLDFKVVENNPLKRKMIVSHYRYRHDKETENIIRSFFTSHQNY